MYCCVSVGFHQKHCFCLIDIDMHFISFINYGLLSFITRFQYIWQYVCVVCKLEIIYFPNLSRNQSAVSHLVDWIHITLSNNTVNKCSW